VIVISGALVLVALVLLVLGLTMTDLDFVYGSIAVSLVSFVFLVIGILQRRGEQPASSGPEVTEGATGKQDEDDATTKPVPVAAAAAPAKRGATGSVPVVEDADEQYDDDELEPGGGPVLVVAGRPRYHVEGCRYLTGKDAEELDVLDAREDGFTACGVCKPDEVLEEIYGPYDEVGDEELVEEEADDEVDDTGVPGAGDDEPEPVRPRRGAGSRAVPEAVAAAPSGRGRGSSAPTKQLAKSAPAVAKKAPGKAAAKKAAAPATATVRAAGPAGGAAASTAPTGRTKVVVIPDRDRFHVPSCRFVRDALGTEELSRSQADKQGYRACGVCRP
jgi:hypothetical protein